MNLAYSSHFIKEYRSSPEKIKKAFKQRLKLFIKNKYDPILNGHPLKGQLQGYRSINITGDWRAIYAEYDQGNTIYFIVIGPHSKLYC